MVQSFKVGDLVRIKPSSRGAAPGIYEVSEVAENAVDRERLYVLTCIITRKRAVMP